LLAAAGTLASAFAGGWLAFMIVKSYWAAATAALLFLSYGFVTWHATSARCDTVALFFCLLGFLVAYRFQRSASILWSLPFLMLGLFFKPLFLGAPAGILLFLALERRYRVALQFCALSAMGGVILIGVFHYLVFPGQAFFQHFITYNLLPFSWVLFFVGVVLFFLSVIFPLFFGAVVFLKRRPDPLLLCYLACSVVWGVVAFSRAGSNSYYFLEGTVILVSLMAGALAQEAIKPLVGAGLMLCLGISLVSSQIWFTPAQPQPQDFVQDRSLQDYLKENFPKGSPALGYYSGELIRAGLETPITNLFHYHWLIRKGILPEEALADQLREQRFRVIVLTYDIGTSSHPLEYLTETTQRAILANYKMVLTQEMPGMQKVHPADRYYIWVPASESGTEPQRMN
jgi:hypothetical protein